MLEKLRCSVDVVAALEDRLRREVYLFVREQARPTTRDEIAAHVQISERLAAFHLEKLVAKGLLRAHFARKPGRSGPGAGRTSKFYEPSDIEIDVSIPERHYDFVGEILVASMEAESSGESPREASVRIARERGRALAVSYREELSASGSIDEKQGSASTRSLLNKFGFEPHEEHQGTIALRSCPFHTLARQAPKLVCGINHAFIDGFLRGLGDDSMVASLEPAPDRCCVKLRSTE